MTDSIKPTYGLWAWMVEGGKVYFSIIENKGIQECLKFYEYHEIFMGKSATVYVFFNDYDLRRSDCKTVATRYMRGDYVRIDCNIKTGETITTKGFDKTNPPL